MKKTDQGGSWGLSVTYELQNPPPPSLRYPAEIVAFSWRLYLLKSNPRWTEELLKYADLQDVVREAVDPGSAPWRILFEVVEDTIEFKGDTLNVVYRDAAGDVIELWADAPDGAWQANNLTGSLSAKPAIEPAALVWNQNPDGPSEHVIFRGTDNKIYELQYESSTYKWTLMDVTTATNDGGTPTGKPAAFVWSDGTVTSLHIGYRGSGGSIHALRRDGKTWQPAGDPSHEAHATGDTQTAAGDPVGFAWERTRAPQTIHWFFRTNTDDNVGELWRGDGGPSTWSWNNLSQKAAGGAGNSTHPVPVAEMLPGFGWAFDPVMGSSPHVYFIGTDQHVYEISYTVPDPAEPGDGYWRWTDLTTAAKNAPLAKPAAS